MRQQTSQRMELSSELTVLLFKFYDTYYEFTIVLFIHSGKTFTNLS